MKSTFLNLNEIVILLTIIECLFLCLALWLLPRGRSQPRQLLIAFFLLVVGTLSTTLVIWNPYLQAQAIGQTSWVPALLSMCLLLEGPVLYAYLRSLSEELKLWRWINLLHLVPALLAALVILWDDVTIVDWLPWHWEQLSHTKREAIRWSWALFKCWPLVYVLACFYAEYRLRQQFKQVYSSISRWELRWADLVLAGFFIHWFWSFIAYFLGGYLSADANDLLGVLNNYWTVLLVNGLFVFALVNGRQLLDTQVLKVTEVPSEASEPANLDDKQALIERALVSQKPYLDSQINLERFAERVGLKPRELSFILNSRYRKNFFEFINELRVEEVKRQLESGSQQTILEIAYAAGFNSQSAFQRFFKRVVGVPPSEYRRNLQAAKTAT